MRVGPRTKATLKYIQVYIGFNRSLDHTRMHYVVDIISFSLIAYRVIGNNIKIVQQLNYLLK